MLVISSLLSLPFLNPAGTPGRSRLAYCWSLAWRMLSVTLLTCEVSAVYSSLTILWYWNENWPFPARNIIKHLQCCLQKSQHSPMLKIIIPTLILMPLTCLSKHNTIWINIMTFSLLINFVSLSPLTFPGGSDGIIFCLKCRRPRFATWVKKIHWEREWQPTPVFLPEEFHGQRMLAGYSLWGHKELDMTEQLTLSLSPS